MQKCIEGISVNSVIEVSDSFLPQADYLGCLPQSTVCIFQLVISFYGRSVTEDGLIEFSKNEVLIALVKVLGC